MKIEIWSDIACPFCYIGKRRFETALADFEYKNDVEVEWKSFQLDPTPENELPKQIDVYSYLAQRKNISVQESKVMHDQVSEMAKSVGLNYNFDTTVIANTFNASRLIHLAKEEGKQGMAKESLLAAYFEQGQDVANIDVLTKIGIQIGLAGERVESMLNSSSFEKEVNDDFREAQSIGVSGVPFFVFDRKYAISGAQDSIAFLQTLQKSFSEFIDKKKLEKKN